MKIAMLLTLLPLYAATALSTGSFVVDPAHHLGEHCVNPGYPSVNQWSAYAQRVSGATSATQCVGDAGAASSGCGDYMFWKLNHAESGECWCVKASYGPTTCADVVTTAGPYTIYKRSAAKPVVNADFIDCTHEKCLEWTCTNWCHCYEEKFDKIYATAKCIGEDTCNCGEMDNAPVVVAPHSYKLLTGTACKGRNELPSQPGINLDEAKHHCDGISSCVSFEMSLCDASGNCNFNFSTTCVESTSRTDGNGYANFDLYIKE